MLLIEKMLQLWSGWTRPRKFIRIIALIQIIHLPLNPFQVYGELSQFFPYAIPDGDSVGSTDQQR
jgi:hypothetical protein